MAVKHKNSQVAKNTGSSPVLITKKNKKNMKNFYARYSTQYTIKDKKKWEEFYDDEELQEEFRSRLEDNLNHSEDFTRHWFMVDYDDMWWDDKEGGCFSLDVSISPNLDQSEWMEVFDGILSLTGAKFSGNLTDDVLSILPQGGFVWETILWNCSEDGGFINCPVPQVKNFPDKQILVSVKFTLPDGKDWMLDYAVKTSEELLTELVCE